MCFSLISVVVTNTTTGGQLTGTFLAYHYKSWPITESSQGRNSSQVCLLFHLDILQPSCSTDKKGGRNHTEWCLLAGSVVSSYFGSFIIQPAPPPRTMAHSLAWGLLVTVKPIHQQSCSQAILIGTIL